MDSRGDAEMLNFFIGYCSGYFICPIFLNPLWSGFYLNFFIGYCSGYFICPIFLNPLWSGFYLLLAKRKAIYTIFVK